MNNFLACQIGGCQEDFTWLIILIVLAVIIVGIIAYIIYRIVNSKKNK